MEVGYLIFIHERKEPILETGNQESTATLSTETLLPDSPVWLSLPEYPKYNMPNINTTPIESNLKNYRQAL